MKSRTFSSFAYPNFRLWFVSNLVAATATWMQRVAQTWVVLVELTDNSTFAVGLLTALQFAPQLVMGLVGGALADWVNKRRFLQLNQAVIAIQGLVMGAVLLGGWAQLWHVYLIAFVTGCFDALSSSVRMTFISETVPKESLPNAIGLNSASFNLARLLGPAAAGVMIAWLGTGWVFVVTAVIFLVPILLLAVMCESSFYPLAHRPRHKGMIREGFAYARTRSDVKAIILLIIVTSGLGFNMQMTQAIMATQVYGKGPGEYGLLGSMLAIGSLCGALLAARRTRPRFALVLGAIFAFGVAESVLALAPSYWAFALLSVPTGFCMLSILTGANALLQVSTPEELRGRVLSIYFSFNLGSTLVGAPTVGWIGEVFGPRWTLLVGGIACILVSGAVFLWARRAWEVRLRPARHWPFLDIDGPRERAAFRVKTPTCRVEDSDPREPGHHPAGCC